MPSSRRRSGGHPERLSSSAPLRWMPNTAWHTPRRFRFPPRVIAVRMGIQHPLQRSGRNAFATQTRKQKSPDRFRQSRIHENVLLPRDQQHARPRNAPGIFQKQNFPAHIHPFPFPVKAHTSSTVSGPSSPERGKKPPPERALPNNKSIPPLQTTFPPDGQPRFPPSAEDAGKYAARPVAERKNDFLSALFRIRSQKALSIVGKLRSLTSAT